MQTSEIRAVFKRAYNGKPNIMTPTVLDYGKRGDHLFEISTGRGMRGDPIFGVTVLTVRGDRCRDLSDCFSTHAEAIAHTETLPRSVPHA